MARRHERAIRLGWSLGARRHGRAVSPAAPAYLATGYGATSELLARENTLLMLVPSVVKMVTATTAMRTITSAYSTSPCPRPVLIASSVR